MLLARKDMDLTVSGIITLVATTGILSAVLTQVMTGFREARLSSRKNYSQARYHALRIAVILETYAYTCAKFIADNANAQTPPDQEFPDWTVRLPELSAYPEDTTGWHAMDLHLATRALDLRNHIVGSQGVIWSTAEFVSDELEHALDEHASERGQEAWNLAADLRSEYKIAPFKPVWDFTDTLESARRSAVRAKSERQRRQEAMFVASGMTKAI